MKFQGGPGLTINWTDVSTGSDGDPYDLSFAVTNTDKGSSQNIFKNITIEEPNGTDIQSWAADNNNDTFFIREQQVDGTDGIVLSSISTGGTDRMGIAHANTSDQADSNNANGTVIQDITLDTYGHIQTIGTTNLDTRYDDYSSWTLTADSGTNQVISSGNTVDIEGGTGISTVVSATDKVTVNLAKAYLLKAIQNSGSNNNPKLELDGSNPDSSDTVTLTGGTGTVSYTHLTLPTSDLV